MTKIIEFVEIKFAKIKKFANFFKNFLLELQKRHYVSQGCVTMRLFKRKFALKSVIERGKNGYHRRDTFHRRGDCRGGTLCCGFCCAGLWISDFGGVLLSWRILGRGWCFGERCFSGAQAQKTSKTSTFKQSLLVVKAQKDWKFRQALFGVAVKFVSDG